MNYLEFFSSVITSLVWPILVVTIALLFRQDVSLMLSRVKKIKHKESEIDLAEEVIEATRSAGLLLEFSEAKVTTEQLRIERLAEDSPRGAILDSWLAVDEALTNYGKKHGIDDTHFNATPFRKIEQIRNFNLKHATLNSGVFEMLDKLRRIRNDAVHKTDAEITSETARNYATLASQVKTKLEEA